MNLRVAKIIKWVFENFIFIIAGIWFINMLLLSGPETALIIVGALVGAAVLAGVVWGATKLYEKADRTVKEIEEGDFEDDV